MFLKAAEFIGEKPEDCAVIEDAEAGIDAAKAGGFTGIGIGEASRYSKTDYPITHFSQLLGLVEK